MQQWFLSPLFVETSGAVSTEYLLQEDTFTLLSEDGSLILLEIVA